MRKNLLALATAIAIAFVGGTVSAAPVDPNGELNSSAAVGSYPNGVAGGTISSSTTSFTNIPVAYTVIGTGNVLPGTYNIGAATGNSITMNVSSLDTSGSTLPLIMTVVTATDTLYFTFNNKPADWSYDAGVGTVPGSLHAVYVGTFSDKNGDFNVASASMIFTWSQVQAGGNVTSSFILDAPGTFQVPEPASLALLGAGLLGLGMIRRRNA